MGRLLRARTEGLALYAAVRTLPVPTEPLAWLWHASLLREHRGDDQVAAVLVSAGIGGREAHVLHALAKGMPASSSGVMDGKRFASSATTTERPETTDFGISGEGGLRLVRIFAPTCRWQCPTRPSFEWRNVPHGRWQGNGHMDVTDLP